jgi:hypothetical protein
VPNQTIGAATIKAPPGRAKLCVTVMNEPQPAVDAVAHELRHSSAAATKPLNWLAPPSVNLSLQQRQPGELLPRMLKA